MKKVALISVLLILAPKILLADTPNFDFIEYGYTSSNVDGLSQNLTGADWGGSYAFGDNLFLALDYFRADAKDSEDKIEIRTYGLGYRFNYSDSTTLYSALAGNFIDPNGHENHQKGYVLTTGARSNIGNNFELKGELKIFDTKHYNMATLVAGVSYNFTDFFAAFTDVEIESDSTRTTFGVRYSF